MQSESSLRAGAGERRNHRPERCKRVPRNKLKCEDTMLRGKRDVVDVIVEEHDLEQRC